MKYRPKNIEIVNDDNLAEFEKQVRATIKSLEAENNEVVSLTFAFAGGEHICYIYYMSL